ncbi:MAG: hypothetical protein LC104_08775 [Bacteroidales bacterium]|nr:hypothetical protein [Bacteroidales bacterium]
MTSVIPRLAPITAPAIAAVILLGTARPATAGWDNVFQVCCNDCRKPAVSYYAPPAPVVAYAPPAPVVAYAAPACPTPCPPQPKVEYQQRCYYEPITVMKPEKYIEQVPVQTKSFYWEPVTSYSYSSYYDPCSSTCQQIAVPRTSYRLREQCNTVMRCVERIRMVAVQSQRKVCETQPVVTYYGAPTRTYYTPAPVVPMAPTAPQVQVQPGNPPTVTQEPSQNIAPPVTPLPTTPGTSLPRSMPPAQSMFNARTTSRTAQASVRGEVVQSDTVTPRAGAKLVFVNTRDLKQREYVTADNFGSFDVQLPAGNWYIYLGSGTGRAEYHKQITVAAADTKDYTIVSR